MRTVRASEIGTYLYCRRAWWYQRQGTLNANQAQMAAGSALHEQHGYLVLQSGCLRVLGYGALLAALALLAAYVTRWVF